nr:hypothetical protein [Tanacetum cinerariifolium]
MPQPMHNLKDSSDPTTAIDMTLALVAKEFTLNNTTLTNNNQRSSLNPSNMQIAQPCMKTDQDRHMLMVEDNVGNQFRPNAMQNVRNQYGNGNVVPAPGEGNGNENNLQQASTSGTQSDKAPVYDSKGSAEVDLSKNCYDNDIFNMFTQEEQYTKLLEPIPEPHQVPQNDSNVISEVFSVEQGGGIVEQHPANVKSLKEEMHEMRNNCNNREGDHASMNDDTPMCERHEEKYIQYEEFKNDVRNDLEDFKRCIHSMRTIHDKLFDRGDGKTIEVLPNKKSKTVNQEPQSKANLEKSIIKFLDGQRVTNRFFKNNVIDMILKMNKNEKNFQTKIKNIERKIDEWSKSKNISLEQTNRTEPPPLPQAHTEHVNAVFTESGKSDDFLKIQKDPPPHIIFNNKIKKD